jgi:hypothetical protein
MDFGMMFFSLYIAAGIVIGMVLSLSLKGRLDETWGAGSGEEQRIEEALKWQRENVISKAL